MEIVGCPRQKAADYLMRASPLEVTVTNPNGAAIATSPILAIASTTQQAAALAEAGDTCVVALPDGIEISGTQQVGLSQVCSAITGVVYASLIGFEY